MQTLCVFFFTQTIQSTAANCISAFETHKWHWPMNDERTPIVVALQQQRAARWWWQTTLAHTCVQQKLVM